LKYAEQHLQVAMASIYVSQDLGLPPRPFGAGSVNQKLPDRWAAEIEKDPYLLFRAAAGAEKIKGHFFSLAREAEQAQDERADVENEPVKLSVPFAERGEAKELGAYFLRDEKLWVSSPDNKNLPELTERWPYDPEKLRKNQATKETAPKKTYLDVAFEEKDQVKELGGKFDFREKQWYVEVGKDLSPFVQWLSEEDRKTLPVMTPEEEFAVILEKAGLVLKEAPVRDGKPHKVPVIGQKNAAAQGTYCFMPDLARPSFYLNHLSGVSDTWTYSGQMLSESKKAELSEELGDKKQRLRQEKAATHEKEQLVQGLTSFNDLNRAAAQSNAKADQAQENAPVKNSGLGR
jgi:hypothetical protein